MNSSPNRRASAGVTLLELLVSLTLLSLIAVGVLFAFRIGLSAMEKSNDRLMSNRRVLSVERILTAQIAGFVPARADCRSGPESPPSRLPFFQGDPQTMRFVSTYSLQEASRGLPRILEFQVIPGENGRGVRLVVNEHLYTGPLSTGMFCTGLVADPGTQTTTILFRPVQIGSASFVLADRLASCQFWYKQEREPPAPPIWRPKWTLQMTPHAVRVDLQPLEPDPAKLQVPAVVAPFRVDRDPMGTYREFP